MHAHLIILSSIHHRHHNCELCTLHSVLYINQAPGVKLEWCTKPLLKPRSLQPVTWPVPVLWCDVFTNQRYWASTQSPCILYFLEYMYFVFSLRYCTLSLSRLTYFILCIKISKMCIRRQVVWLHKVDYCVVPDPDALQKVWI